MSLVENLGDVLLKVQHNVDKSTAVLHNYKHSTDGPLPRHVTDRRLHNFAQQLIKRVEEVHNMVLQFN